MPSPKKRRDETKKRRDEMHLWIGRCISEWANIEETIFDICNIALETQTKLAAIVFYKTPSLTARLSLTTELLQVHYPITPGAHPHPIFKQWSEIDATIQKLIPYRNLMAHQPLDTEPNIYPSKEDILHIMEGGSPRLSPLKISVSKSEEIRGRKFKIDKIIDGDMPNYYEQVRDLYKSIVSFRTSLQRELFTAHQHFSQDLSFGDLCEDAPLTQTRPRQ